MGNWVVGQASSPDAPRFCFCEWGVSMALPLSPGLLVGTLTTNPLAPGAILSVQAIHLAVVSRTGVIQAVFLRSLPFF